LRWRGVSVPARLAGACLRVLRGHRRLRVAVLLTLICSPLLAGGWLWLRHSSLVSVDHVRVSGVQGPDALAIEAALTDAARHMSTLDVRPGALRAAVAPFRVVREVRVSVGFPHSLRIRVIEQLPVATLVVGAARTAVAADGVVLGPALLSASLPVLHGVTEPGPGQRVRVGSELGALSVLGAAPAPLARMLASAFTGSRGLTLVMRGGLLAYFGDGSRPHAKWLSLARVLADPTSAGAAYVDVRVPERAAAGFAAGGAPAGTAASEQTGAESTAATLAAGLTTAAGNSSGQAEAPAGSPSTQATTTPAEATPSTPSETAAPGSQAPAGTPESGG
jgi:cell division septal protein FtsQ